MAKIRVYELATKLGLDNKQTVDKLNQAGIEVKNHMSALDEEVALKFETGQINKADKAVEVKVDEERISSGLIRRRRKTVAEEEPIAVKAPAEEAAPVAPESEEPVEHKPAAVEEPVEVAKEPAEAVKPSQVTPEGFVTEEPTEEKVEKAEAVVPEKKKAKKEVITRAKILGRVELPTPAERPRRQATSPERGKKPAPADRTRPDRPSRPERPSRPAAPSAPNAPIIPDVMADKEDRSIKKKKKGRDNISHTEADGQRRKTKREVYEPDRNERFRKGRKANRPTKKTEITQSKAIKRKIRITDVITIGELAKRMGVKANDLIKELMRQGQMVTINHPLDFESAAILAAEFGYEVENVAFDEDTILSHSRLDIEAESAENQLPRPPVITIMGHVDHG
ncbi:MAG: translation initiation factor IF-2 N-terminal domain-containing protein, partial [Desulfuromonadales bacterium]|nr:translation initiation factor IF-2 N-terminal domain-containing protein [Desulfuromonadales bacterium]